MPTARSTARPRTQHRLPAGPRSDAPTRRSISRCRCAIRRRPAFIASNVPLAPSPYWGDETDLGQPDQRAQSDVRREGPRLVDGAHPRRRRSRRSAKQGSDHPSAKLFPMDRAGRQLAMYDPEDREVQLCRSLLHHAPHAVRRGREQHAVVSARRRRATRRRLAQHQEVRRDRRRAEVAGLDARSSSTPTATASATKAMSSPNQPVDPDQGQAHRRRPLWHRL